jgi:hypothetical protein
MRCTMTRTRQGGSDVAGTGRRRGFGSGTMLFILALSIVLGACSTPAPRRTGALQPSPPPPPTQVYFYPTAGQTPEQQDRDRYECYRWAVQQTGFDPSAATIAPHQRIEVVPSPPSGHDTAVGAATGAILGAVVAGPRDSAGGAVVGAIAGAAIGAASDAEREERARQIQRQYEQRDAQNYVRLERQAQDYRRAMSACLEGRGYTVQ